MQRCSAVVSSVLRTSAGACFRVVLKRARIAARMDQFKLDIQLHKPVGRGCRVRELCRRAHAIPTSAVRNLDDLETMACPPKYRAMNTFYKYYSGEKKAPYPTLFSGHRQIKCFEPVSVSGVHQHGQLTLQHPIQLVCAATVPCLPAVGDNHEACGDWPTLFAIQIGVATVPCLPAVGDNHEACGDWPTLFAIQISFATVPCLPAVGGNHEASNYMWELYHGGWAAPNIRYLGAAGCIKFGGLRIAGLSGIYKQVGLSSINKQVASTRKLGGQRIAGLHGIYKQVGLPGINKQVAPARKLGGLRIAGLSGIYERLAFMSRFLGPHIAGLRIAGLYGIRKQVVYPVSLALMLVGHQCCDGAGQFNIAQHWLFKKEGKTRLTCIMRTRGKAYIAGHLNQMFHEDRRKGSHSWASYSLGGKELHNCAFHA
eukprot:69951-Pelagomonas_calceolata.AAC.1